MISAWHEGRSGSSEPIWIVRFDVAYLFNTQTPFFEVPCPATNHVTLLGIRLVIGRIFQFHTVSACCVVHTVFVFNM